MGASCARVFWGLVPGLFLALSVAGEANAQSKIYWTNSTVRAIQRANLDGTGMETLVSGVESLGIAVDGAGGKMYWTDLGSSPAAGDERILRANLDGSGIEVLVTGLNVLRHPTEIRLDLPGGKMYWTDSGWARIYRANLDGSAVELLVDAIALRPPNYGGGPGQVFEFSNTWGLALDLAAGQMYWSDYFARDIHRANLDGSNVSGELVSGLLTPRGMTLDVVDNRMYWTEAPFNQARIQRSDLDGAFVEQLLPIAPDKMDGPLDIEVDLAAGKMYWTDMEVGTVQRADLDGANLETLLTLEYYDAKKDRWRGHTLWAIDLDLVPTTACSDGIDNDGDGLIDFPADPQCVSAADNREARNRRCGLLGIELLLVAPVWMIARKRRAQGTRFE